MQLISLNLLYACGHSLEAHRFPIYNPRREDRLNWRIIHVLITFEAAGFRSYCGRLKAYVGQ